MRDEREVWGCSRRRRKMRRGRGGQWEREIVGLPGLQSLSVILCVNQPIPRLRCRYSSCVYESIYIYTHTCTKHTFSHFINARWKLEISLFILCHSLIRFHHHSNPFPSTFSLFSYLTHTLCHTVALQTFWLFPWQQLLPVCLSVLPWRKGRGDGGGGGGDLLMTIKWP